MKNEMERFLTDTEINTCINDILNKGAHTCTVTKGPFETYIYNEDGQWKVIETKLK